MKRHILDENRRYVLISPCRNEAEYMRQTLDSVAAQTIPPVLWVIVDDGSRDETPGILEEYEERYGYIRVLRREDRGGRSVGPGVIEAFYTGYRSVDPREFDYLCKLDLDIELPQRYFEILIQRMEADPRLGTCSGKPYVHRNESSKLVCEPCGDEMSVGMTKFYRKECFEQIGGFVPQVMWDGIDCHRCRLLGWIACSWDVPELRFVHLRPMGSSERGMLTGRMRHGFGQYYMGTSVSYITVSAFYRMFHPPYIIGGLAILWGFMRSMLRREPRLGDRRFREFLRGYQRACLVQGKTRATEVINRKQAGIWKSQNAVGRSVVQREMRHV